RCDRSSGSSAAAACRTPALVREHGERAGIRLIHRLVSGAEDQPGQPSVVTGNAPAAEEELIFQVLEYGHHRLAAVGSGPAGQAGNGARPGLRAYVVEIPDVDAPGGAPPPHPG